MGDRLSPCSHPGIKHGPTAPIRESAALKTEISLGVRRRRASTALHLVQQTYHVKVSHNNQMRTLMDHHVWHQRQDICPHRRFSCIPTNYLRCCSGSQSRHSIPLLGAAETLKLSLAADPLTLSSCRSSCAAWITTYRSADRAFGSTSVGVLRGALSKFDVLL